MWNVEYKPTSDSQTWVILKSYDNKTSACFKAFQVSNNYFMVKVMDTDGNVLWRQHRGKRAIVSNIESC
jgi:hypothetical protein